jgi:uncharacterized BrkB/YihY/UPF0761 family membrane protein
VKERIREAVEWLTTTAWRPVVIARAVYERDRDIGGGLLAGAIAFRFFVWLAAFVVVIVAVLGFISAAGGDAAAAIDGAGVTAIAARQVAESAADAQRGRWLLLLGGLYALFATSRTVVRALWTASAIVARKPVTRAPVVKGVLAYNGAMLLLLGTIRGAGRLREATPGPGLVITLLTVVVFVGITWVTLRWLPGPDVPARDLLPGAILLGVGVHLMNLVSTLYLPGRIERASDTYGALGIAIVLLLWLYLLGRLIVAGGVLNATLRQLREDAAE